MSRKAMKRKKIVNWDIFQFNDKFLNLKLEMNGREFIIILNFGLNTITFFSPLPCTMMHFLLCDCITLIWTEGDTVIKCSSISTPLLNTSLVGAEWMLCQLIFSQNVASCGHAAIRSVKSFQWNTNVLFLNIKFF